MCLFNTDAPDNGPFKNSQGRKEKYLDTCRKILSHEMLKCNMKTYYLIFKYDHYRKSKGLVPTKRAYHKKYSCGL